MKKLVIFALLLSIVSASLFACSTSSDHFKGQWKFSKISKIKLDESLDEDIIADLKEGYGAEDVNGIEAKALEKFKNEKTFDPCYINFDKKRSYTYDPAMEREATWVFYQTGDNEGFLSFYGELDAADGNPDPVTCPPIVYNAESDTLLMTIRYVGFDVTIEFIR